MSILLMKEFKNIIKKMEMGVQDGVFPGAVLLVGFNGKVIFHEAFGYAQLIPDKRKMTKDTIFDIASLTKVIATVTAIMLLVREEKIKIDNNISNYIPGFLLSPKKKITIRHLLTHSSGLPSWKPYFKSL